MNIKKSELEINGNLITSAPGSGPASEKPRETKLFFPMDASATTATVAAVPQPSLAKIPSSTELSTATQDLKLTADQLEFSLAAAKVGAFVWDLVQNTRIRTKMANDLLGLEASPEYTPSYFEQMVEQAVHPEDRTPLKDYLRNIIQSLDTELQTEYRVVWPDGSTHYVVTRGQIIRDSTGKALQVIGTTFDISRLKLAEQAYETQTRKRVEEVKIHEAQLKEFVYYLCHEIRNPLTGVFGGFDWLNNIRTTLTTLTPGSPLYSDALRELTEATQAIQQSAEHMKDIVDETLDLGKLQAGKVELNKTRFDPRQTVAKIITLLRPELLRKNIGTQVIMDHVDKMIEGDEHRLSQVLSNLLTNAIKFTENGQITTTISLASTANITPEEKQDALPNLVTSSPTVVAPLEKKSALKYLKCSVADTGIGMDKEELARIFTPFGQANARISRKFGGTGLGLTISQHLVKLMDGEIAVSSQKKQGTTFTFTVGCRVLKISPILPRKSTSQAKIAPMLTGKHILIVDDLELNRKMLIRMLDSTGCTIDTASNGQEAVEIYKKSVEKKDEKSAATPLVETAKKIDFIFMDIIMPIMDGLEATRQILAIDFVSIVGLSGNSNPEDKLRAKAAGMVNYLTKPFLPDNIFAALERALFPASANASSVGDSPLLLSLPEVKRTESPGSLTTTTTEKFSGQTDSALLTMFLSSTGSITPEPPSPNAGKMLAGGSIPPGETKAIVTSSVPAALSLGQRDPPTIDSKNAPSTTPQSELTPAVEATCWYSCWDAVASFFQSVRDCACCGCSSCRCASKSKIAPSPYTVPSKSPNP